MKKIFSLLLIFPLFATAQYSLKIIIKNKVTGQSLQGATLKIKQLKINLIADSAGVVLVNNISKGQYDIEVTNTGFKETEQTIYLPLKSGDSFFIYLAQEAQEMNEVTVLSTRSNRSIKNTPTRVEVISGEEVAEEATMRPGDIRMLLAESTGIQTQQTSATTANASIRIQGLDGRYTQILKDGFPIYSGAASGLGLLQTPPLDLRQVEIIKGSSSTLYGGGAIAGLVNLITKIPANKKELNFHLNFTSAGGLDINSFFSKRFKKTGVTFFLARNSNKAYDPANSTFSAIPKFERYTINPKLFLYLSDKTNINIGINFTSEDRLGGDMQFIKGKGDSIHRYFEGNITKRLSTQFTFDHQLSGLSSIKIKNSLSYYNRMISSKNYEFNGTQYSSFTEASYLHKRQKSDWVAGLNILTDNFIEGHTVATLLRNYNQTTVGAFVQNTWNTIEWLTVETGLRSDYVPNVGSILLPRVSALFKIIPHFTSRIGGGLGYKPPTIFTEESERLLYKNVLPINTTINKFERSYGANWDVNYKVSIDRLTMSLNQLLFYTYLKNPLFLSPAPNGLYIFNNIAGHIISKGAETNIKLSYNELSLYLAYTYTNAKLHNNGIVTDNPLTPKHRFNAAVVYEIEGKWKFGSELYYFGKQNLNNGTEGKDYWLSGLVAEKVFKKVSVFINFENFGDVRQTRFESIYTGTVTNPVFKDIYAPLEGFVVNGGLKIKL